MSTNARPICLHTIMATSAIAAALLASGLSGLVAQSLPAWRLVEVLSVGSVDDSASAFNTITNAAIAGDGRLWFAQWNVGEIRAVSLTGSLSRGIGRRGAGPGEFMFAGPLGFHGSVLWVLDPAARRVTRFNADGSLLGTELISPVQFSTGIRSVPRAVLKSGALLEVPFIDPLWPPPHGTLLPVVTARGDGTAADTIALLSDAQETVAIRLRLNRIVNRRHPLYDGPLVEPLPDGTGIMVVDRKASGSSATATFRISRIGERGDTVFTRSIAYKPIALTASRKNAIHASIADALHQTYSEFTLADIKRTVAASVALPGYLPPVSGCLIATDGRILLRLEEAGEPNVRWLILDNAGNSVGTLVLPATTRLIAAEQRAAWAAKAGSDGEPILVKYRFER